MTKQKKDARAAGEFRNTPFGGLKKLVPREKMTVPGSPPVPATSVRHEGDEDELFRRAMAGARPVSRDDDAQEAAGASACPLSQKTQSAGEDPSGGEQFLRAMQTLGAASLRPESGEDEREPPRRSVSGRMRRLKKGSLRISSELDLHGFVREEALRRLDHFLENAFARGQQAVLVITGKGINSVDGPVLQAAVAERLRAKSGAIVAEFHPAPRDRGGSGAFVVFLRGK